MTSQELVKKAVRVLDDKKANEICVMKVEGLTSVTDYFVIASANSSTHVKSLADEVEFQLKEIGVEPHKVEGYQYANWIVLDYYQVIVHVFNTETREFYSLENLWRDGEKIDIKEFLD